MFVSLCRALSLCCASFIPQQPGFGTLDPSRLAPQVLVPCKMLNGRKLLDKGESPSFDQHSFIFAEQKVRVLLTFRTLFAHFYSRFVRLFAQLAFRGNWESIGEVRDHYL